MPDPIPLGPFDLHEPLAHGGMGTVWRGIHRDMGLPVAVKVVDADAGPELTQALQHEVSTIAGLDHPNVIRVWDQGTVDRAAARASGGRLQPRSPWFAMELAHGRIGLGEPVRYFELRAQILQLLSALAHAHARGILHRDLKPGNILLVHQPDGTRVPKLTDFGMGWRIYAATGPIAGGTPHWMAPEQFLEDRGLQGPWTDLYSLGCVTFALLAGHPPFRAGRSTDPFHLEAMREAHLHHPFPPLPPEIAVPRGFEAWLAGLVAKDPADRWPHAADAAVALAALGDPPQETPTPSLEEEEMPTVRLPAQSSPPPGSGGRGGRRGRRPGPVAPCPDDWREVGAAVQPGQRPGGVGLGLVGLRPVPVVGRTAEQDAAWAALKAVAQQRSPRLVLFEGPAGFGKSRLAEWLTVTANEAGAAEILRAVYRPEQGLRDGLPGLVARHYRIDPALDRGAVREEVARLLLREGETDPEEADRITALLWPVREDEGQTEEQRALLVERLIARRSVDRPVVIWLDDLHRSLEGIALARRILAGGALPALVVATVQEEALSERPAAKEALEALVAAAPERVTRLRLGPLATADHATLVQELLGLTGELAARVEARTEGNPLFATQLVKDWVQRGLLVPTPLGFHLSGACPSLPDSIVELWERRLRGVGAQDDRWRFPLELAAALGQQVELSEWVAAAREAGLPWSDVLVMRVVQQRLMRAEPGYDPRLSFVHGMLRESLLQSAARAGRTGRWHRAAAAMVRARGGADADERVGRHLLVAGDVEAAAPYLLEAVRDRTRTGEAPLALELAATLDAALASRPTRQPDPTRAELAVLRAAALRVLGHLAEARALVDPYALVARQLPPRIRALVLREHALARLHTAGASEDLYNWLAEAKEAAQLAAVPTLVADIEVEVARALEYHGRIKEAAAAYQRALAVYEAHGDRRGEGDAYIGLASVANKEGRHDEARTQAQAALERLTELRSTWRLLYCQMLMGEIARFRGNLTQAERTYREVIARYERLVSARQTALPRTNLGLVQAELGHFQDAARSLAEAARGARESGHVNLLRMVELMAAWPSAGLGDWAAVDAALEVGEVLLSERVVDPDLARAVEHTARLAKAAGQSRRARWAAFLASRLYGALGEEARAQQVAALRR